MAIKPWTVKRGSREDKHTCFDFALFAAMRDLKSTEGLEFDYDNKIILITEDE